MHGLAKMHDLEKMLELAEDIGVFAHWPCEPSSRPLKIPSRDVDFSTIGR
jgi:hypothetical protein